MTPEQESIAARTQTATAPGLLTGVLLAALAGGMGWGIRGQYGHETGAMIAGLLVSTTLVLFWRPNADWFAGLRAIGLCTAAVGFGGAMTYGQTIGLTQNPEIVGNSEALAWGMTGLALKGAVWIGFAGVFFGMGLSGIRYRATEFAGLLAAVTLLAFSGIWLLNEPYDPANRVLPRVYFSATWSWYPLASAELKPRREIWGGLGLALVGLMAYARLIRKDALAFRMGLWGCAGGLGFPIGQTLQAWRAWNPELFAAVLGQKLDGLINWWNVMEILFGATWGAAIAMGLWCNRRSISSLAETPRVTIPFWSEATLLSMQMVMLWLLEFGPFEWIERMGDLGIAQAVIPLIAVIGGRFWAAWLALPVTAFPIIIKTLRHAGLAEVWQLLLAALLCAALCWTATYLTRSRSTSRQRLAILLLTVVWFYWLLNFSFFNWPWVWQSWTQRTPSGVVYTICAAALTLFAVQKLRTQELPPPFVRASVS